MPAYDGSRFDPPAPIAAVILRDHTSGATVSDVLLLVDTGADVTLLPRYAVDQLGSGLTTGEQYELAGFDGNTSIAAVVIVDLLFLRRSFRGRYLVIEQELGILGRDVLNHVRIVLDGPRGEWAEHVS
jgi:predicted aspartyl protease